jgi:hypothetical protein
MGCGFPTENCHMGEFARMAGGGSVRRAPIGGDEWLF